VRERWLSLEKVKTIAEIVAILGAGGWALFEFGAKAHEDRLEGLQLKRAALELEADETRVDDGHAWVHARLRVKNVSRRQVTTFMTNWWWTYPDGTGNPTMSWIFNDPTRYELAPGEESELDQTLVVNAARAAVVVHAHVFFDEGEHGTVCRFKDGLSEDEVRQSHDQPSVCAAKPGAPTCSEAGCPSQAAERLVVLKKGAAP
jgi:hypothetical protein